MCLLFAWNDGYADGTHEAGRVAQRGWCCRCLLLPLARRDVRAIALGGSGSQHAWEFM